MKKHAMLIATLCALLFAVGLSASAQDAPKVDGKWELSIKGAQGNMTMTLSFQQEGNNLKGTLKGQRGESPLEGKVEANKIHFTVHRQTPNGVRDLEYSGTVDGDSMKGTAKMGENEREWSASRSKPDSQ